MMTSVAAVNVCVLVIAFSVYATHVAGSVSLLAVAYSLGLRHALDADHIAAIDNVTRRLVQEGKAPLTVGLYFSLGHSTIVVVATMLVAALSSAMEHRFEQYDEISGTVGGAISASFLFLVGTLNAVSLIQLLRHMRATARKAGEVVDELKWAEILQVRAGPTCHVSDPCQLGGACRLFLSLPSSRP